jgi:membrane-associated protein
MNFDAQSWVEAAGYPGMAAAIFAETGLLIGFFLPGDTLLISAGVLAQRGHFSVWLLLPILAFAAIAGDSTGYAIGKSAGPRIFKRPNSRFFKREHLLRAKRFFDRHGGKTIVAARFIGFVRTFAPTVAGAAEMSYSHFLAYNVVGGVAWVTVLLGLGYFVGTKVENLDLLLAVLFGGAAVLSFGGVGWRWMVRRRKAKRGEAEKNREAAAERSR